jgi:hypothetical protein
MESKHCEENSWGIIVIRTITAVTADPEVTIIITWFACILWWLKCMLRWQDVQGGEVMGLRTVRTGALKLAVD